MSAIRRSLRAGFAAARRVTASSAVADVAAPARAIVAWAAPQPGASVADRDPRDAFPDVPFSRSAVVGVS